MSEEIDREEVERQHARMQLIYAEVAASVGCTQNTVVWVNNAISYLSERKRRDSAASDSFHSSAKEVCLALLRDVNVMCPDPVGVVLERLKISTSEDIGKIVYGLAEKGAIQASASDSQADFDGLYSPKTIDVFLREHGIRKPLFSLYLRYRQIMWCFYGVGTAIVIGSYFFDVDRSISWSGWILGMLGFFMQFHTPSEPQRF